MSDTHAVQSQEHTSHKKKFSGGKIKKAKKRDKKERHNPKAFTFSGGVKAVQRRAQYALDRETKRLHASLIPKKINEECPPPLIIAVQGPPKVGKSTLIRSLVKHYTHLNVSSIQGPITLVTGKKRRLTFIECPNDAASMLDTAKVADLVLLLIDGFFGFEMETFEFINILQVTGFPKVIGVLTHLDQFNDPNAVKKTKKKLKNRFWSEIYNGAKLFYLSELRFERYNKREIFNLSRFIAVQGVKPLEFRSQRPYLVPLRYEDQTTTGSSDSSHTRTVHFYGYVNGATLRSGTAIHIPGAGDFIIDDVTPFTDPCPLPISRNSKTNNVKQLRTLKLDEKRIYAPQCDIGHVNFDQDTLYINLPKHQVGFTAANDSSLIKDEERSNEEYFSDECENQLPEPVALVRELQNAPEKLNQQVESLKLRLLPDSHKVLKSSPLPRRRAPSYNEATTATESKNGSYDVDESALQSDTQASSLSDFDVSFDEDSQLEGLDKRGVAIECMTGNRNFPSPALGRNKHKNSLATQIYSTQNFSVAGNASFQPKKDTISLFDTDSDDHESQKPFTSSTTDQPPCLLLGQCPCDRAQQEESAMVDDETYYHIFLNGTQGDPHSLEGLLFVLSADVKSQLKKKHFLTKEWSEVPLGSDASKSLCDRQTEDMREMDESSQEKKTQDLENQKETSETHEHFVDYGLGLAIGTYCRVIIHNLPSVWMDHLKKSPRLVVLGGLLPNECGSSGYIKARVKKHRWAPKILKTEDPLLISMGWRRFQSLPIYCMEDTNHTRCRYLKYTPEHMHCLAVFYGPWAPPNTGVVAIRNWASNVSHFCISATGIILETGMFFNISKKLKLVGEPLKIFKNTAFIKNMFNSDLEVAKCIGSKIQTVSGLRGQIKKAHGKDGVFRATFEDKILMSDIVMCKTWIGVQPKRFCNPLLDLPTWRRIRNLTEIRHALRIPQPDSSKSDYGAKPERQVRRFNPLRTPKDIQKNLPFKSIPKDLVKKKKASGLLTEVTKPTLSPYEKKAVTVLQRLHLIDKQRRLQRKMAALKHKASVEKQNEKVEKEKNTARAERKKRRCAMQSIQRKKIRRRLDIED